MSAVRLPADLTAAIDLWSESHGVGTRSDAIRRLVEIGLAAAPRKGARSHKQTAKAEKLAAGVIDQELAKQDAHGHVKAQRRKALLSGPRKEG